MPVRPPSDIRWQCTEHSEVEASDWTSAWNHQLDEHAGDQTVNWHLLGTAP